MRLKQLIYTGIILGLTTVTAPLSAQEGRWYIGGAVGQSDLDQNGFDEETGWRLYGGYKFVPFVAAEVGYTYLGDFNSNRSNGSVEIDGMETSIIGMLPLMDNFALLGKIGAYWWDSTIDGTLLSLNEDDDVDLTYGIGAEFRVYNQMGIRASWDRYNEVADSDVDLISIGVNFSF